MNSSGGVSLAANPLGLGERNCQLLALKLIFELKLKPLAQLKVQPKLERKLGAEPHATEAGANGPCRRQSERCLARLLSRSRSCCCPFNAMQMGLMQVGRLDEQVGQCS